MNLQLHHVLTDITGVTGLAILDAILAGERDPQVLAEHRDHRVKAAPATIAKALVRDYRPEHLFALRLSLAAYRYYQQLIRECDGQVQTLLAPFPSAIDPAVHPLPAAPPVAPPPPRTVPTLRTWISGPNCTGSSARISPRCGGSTRSRCTPCLRSSGPT